MHDAFGSTRGLSLVVVSGGSSLAVLPGLLIVVASLLQSMGSRRMGFSTCGARAWLLRGMWNLPGSGIEPVSPALAGGFLSTVPPGKSQDDFL